MAWRTHRMSKMHARAKAKDKADDQHHHDDIAEYEDNSGEGGRMTFNHQGRRWRWKRILHRVGWIRMSSDFYGDDDGDDDDHEREMRAMGRRGAVVGEDAAGEGIVYARPIGMEVPSRTRSKPGTETFAAAGAAGAAGGTNKLPKPTDVPCFENLGGYRYGDFAYGPDNMSPLPVPVPLPVPLPLPGPLPVPVLEPVSVPVSVSTNTSQHHRHPQHYHQHSSSQAVAEVEAISVASGTSVSASKRKDPVQARHACSLTSYNGFPSSSQDDIMAALPIPRDHPLSQHHPIGHQYAFVLPLRRARTLFSGDEEEVHRKEQKLEDEDRILQMKEFVLREEVNESNVQESNLQEEGWKAPTFQYERESLVPAPLNPRRGRHSPAARRRSSAKASRTWTAQGAQTKVVERTSPAPASSRPQSCCVSGFGSLAPAGSGTRYSHFENPLRQHPVGGDDGLRPMSEIEARSGPHERAALDLPTDQAEEERETVDPKWPFVSSRRRKRYTFAFDAAQSQNEDAHTPAPPGKGQVEDVDPCSSRIDGQDEGDHPCSVQDGGQATKRSNATTIEHSCRSGDELKIAFHTPKDGASLPISFQFGARHATIPPEFPGLEECNSPELTRQRAAYPPALQIGRSPGALTQQNRHFSVCGRTWTTVRSSSIGRSPEKPMRQTWRAEELKVVGLKRGHEA
ncbi:hypothetical protein G647_08219 [Cladophialophora carrionii CBS 160.54]|uniref:Uncharacterized protein n=1 Tax=Cladophialophora carrionii CBS 160.54 TaxID=1279043 RepID=V9CZV8_9EURO|nr:uncharacterized protein G647_08219 [Cladophialophora carrionii CBS 160.54]ETI20185.1 hypothetical protein G647_08219 [Cladophialophora carrionii CBS 160.54]